MGGQRSERFDFESLVGAIGRVHEHCAAQAGRAVNVAVTLRNWAVGLYIREYEQCGSDRAEYGAGMFDALSKRLLRSGIEGMAPRSLRQYRQFYLAYPEIWHALSAISAGGGAAAPIWQTLSAKLGALLPASGLSVQAEEQIPPGAKQVASGKPLVLSLSFSQFAELIAIGDPLKRAFYEIECVRGNWSVRELKRQIGALYFERSGLSKNPEKLAALGSLEKAACGPFSDTGFVSGRKRRGFCGLRNGSARPTGS